MRFFPWAVFLLLPACGSEPGAALPAREQPAPAG